jgi:hypothetical protein
VVVVVMKKAAKE